MWSGCKRRFPPHPTVGICFTQISFVWVWPCFGRFIGLVQKMTFSQSDLINGETRIDLFLSAPPPKSDIKKVPSLPCKKGKDYDTEGCCRQQGTWTWSWFSAFRHVYLDSRFRIPHSCLFHLLPTFSAMLLLTSIISRLLFVTLH